MQSIFTSTIYYTKMIEKNNYKNYLKKILDFTSKYYHYVFYQFLKEELSMKKIAFFSRKGGVGKTTLCCQMALGLAKLNYKVLVIDTDGQANAQSVLGVNELNKSLFDIFDYRYPAVPKEAIVNVRENLDFIGNTNIDLINSDLYRVSRIENYFCNKFKQLDEMEYDFVFVDCSPTESKLNQSIMYFVDEILVPIQLEFLALEGAAGIFSLLKDLEISEKKVKYIVPNLYNHTLNSEKNLNVVKDFFSQYKQIVISEPICRRIKITEANEKSISVFDYDSEAANQILKSIRMVIDNE